MFCRLLLIVLTMAACGARLNAARIDTLQVFSSVMQKEIPCLVIVPDRADSDTSRLNTVYLLHGWSGNYSSWLQDAPQLPEFADRWGLLLVCPDGGYASWYLDSPVDTSIRYETHVAEELVACIDSLYPTASNPSHRAIAGLSMGGHGALYLGIRHSETFGIAGSMAGGFNHLGNPGKWNLQSLLGNPETNRTNWVNASIVGLLKGHSGEFPMLLIDCGLDDFFLDSNRQAREILLERNIPHVYTERPGAHTGDYWGEVVQYQLWYFVNYFRKSGP